jgi:hypothetical protein
MTHSGHAPPQACASINHLVGAGEEPKRESKASAFAVFWLTTSSSFRGLVHGKSAV